MMENYQEEILKVMENYELGLMFIYVPENDSESDGKLFVFLDKAWMEMDESGFHLQ